MTTTLVIMIAVGVAVTALALLQRARPSAPPTATHGDPPSHLDRRDFRSPTSPRLAVVFTSASCASCENVWHEVASLESGELATQNVEVAADAELHRRYAIESVPTTVVVDELGDVELAVIGPLGADERQALHAILAGDD